MKRTSRRTRRSRECRCPGRVGSTQSDWPERRLESVEGGNKRAHGEVMEREDGGSTQRRRTRKRVPRRGKRREHNLEMGRPLKLYEVGEGVAAGAVGAGA